MQKSTSLQVETGKTIAEFEHDKVDYRGISLLGLLAKGIKLVHRDRKDVKHDN